MIERRERFRSESKSAFDIKSSNKYERKKSLSPVSQRYGNIGSNSNSNSNSNSTHISNKISSSSRNGSQSSLNRLADIRRSPSISRMRNNSTDSEIDNKEVQKYLRKEFENTERNENPSFDNKRLSPFIMVNKDIGNSQKNLTAYSGERGRERGRASRDPFIAENHFLFGRDDLTVEGVSVKLNTSNKTGESSRSLMSNTHSSSDNKNRMKDFNSLNHKEISSDSESDSESEKENENSHELRNTNMNKYCDEKENENKNENENSVDRSESQSGVKEVSASSAYKIATAWRDYISHIMIDKSKSSLEEGRRALSRRDSCLDDDDDDDDDNDDNDDDGEVDEDIECVQITRDRFRRRSDEKSKEDGGEGEGEREGEYGEDDENDRYTKHSAQLDLSLMKISKLAKDMVIIPKERILKALELSSNNSNGPKGLQSLHINSNIIINGNSDNNNTRIHAFHSNNQTGAEVIARVGSMDEVENNSTLLRNAFLEVVQSMKGGINRNPAEGFTVDPVKPVRVNPFDLVSDIIDSNFESLNNSLECSAVNSTHTTRRPSLSETGMLHHGIMEYHGIIAESKSSSSTVNLTSRKYDYDDSVKSECNEMSGEYEEEFDSEVESEVENNHFNFNFNSHEIHAMLSSSQEFGMEMKMEKDDKIEKNKEKEGDEGSEDEYNSDFEDEKSM